jgi:hypothetical protein
MSASRTLVLRSDGALWGLPAEAVAAVEQRERGLVVRLARGGELAADAVVALADGLAVRPLAAPVRRRLPAGARGLALLGGEPLVVVEDGGPARGSA